MHHAPSRLSMSDEAMVVLAASVVGTAGLAAWLWRSIARPSNALRAVRGLDGMHLEGGFDRT